MISKKNTSESSLEREVSVSRESLASAAEDHQLELEQWQQLHGLPFDSSVGAVRHQATPPRRPNARQVFATLRGEYKVPQLEEFAVVAVQDVAPDTLAPVSTRTQPLVNLHSPPLKQEGGGAAINIHTRGPELEYTQMGILTRENSGDDLILPLMGRRSSNGRDKYQYYTML